MSPQVILAIFGVALSVAGLGTLLAAGKKEISDLSNGWITYQQIWLALERPRQVERFIYRHHRLFGGAIIVGTLALLIFLGLHHNQWVNASPARVRLGTQVFLLASWVLLAVSLLIGIYVTLRPSALKRMEAHANRWIDPLALVVTGTTPTLQKLFAPVLCTPGQTGALLLLSGLVCLTAAVQITMP